MVLPCELIYQKNRTCYYWRIPKSVSQVQVYNTVTTLYENYNSANWASYANTITETAGTGYYRAIPASASLLVPATEIYFDQGTNGSPSSADAPTIGPGNSQGVDLATVNGSIQAAINLAFAAGTEVVGAAVSGTLSTTQMSTNLSATLTNIFNGRALLWTSGVLGNAGAARVTGYNPSTGVLIFSAMPSPPSSGDAFIIV